MAASPLKGIRACVFDAYGTLFDYASATRGCRNLLGNKLEPLTTLWREKQLQYTWLRSVQRQHQDFCQVTSDALQFSMRSLGLSDPSLHDKLMEFYLTLSPFPEVADTLQRIKAGGLMTAILSNGTPRLLQAAVQHAGIQHLLDAILSVEEVGVFKPDGRYTNSQWIDWDMKPTQSPSSLRTRGMPGLHQRLVCRLSGATATNSNQNCFPANPTVRSGLLPSCCPLLGRRAPTLRTSKHET